MDPSGINGQYNSAFPVESPDTHFLDPSQWTIVDETRDHPGRRKNSGFFQPIKHLSGELRQNKTDLICAKVRSNTICESRSVMGDEHHYRECHDNKSPIERWLLSEYARREKEDPSLYLSIHPSMGL